MSMAMLQRLELHNYRSFRFENVELSNSTFLVGQNGAGKSNFVDAISFISEAMALPLSSAFRLRGGFERVAHRQAKGRFAAIRFYLVLQGLDDLNTQATYDLILRRRRDSGLEVWREHCVINGVDGGTIMFNRQVPKSGKKPMRWSGDIDQPNLTRSTLALPLIGDPRFAPVFDFLSNMRVYRIDPSMLRSSPEPFGDIELDEDGGNAAGVLRHIKKHSSEDWEEICELLANTVPGLAEVQPRRRNGGLTLEFLLNLTGGKARFDASAMSDGTLRALGILLAAYQRPAPSLMVIEEPEASIHPGALGVILDVLREARRSSQVVVTTHSPEILDAKWIRDRHLRLVSWNQGSTRVDAMAPSVKEAMEQQLFSAGELLRSNALDGAERP